MHSLYEIFDLLPKQKLGLLWSKDTELDAKAPSLIKQLLHIISTRSKDYTDDEVAAMIYGPQFGAQYQPFQKLKHKLKYRLLNLVVVMDDLQPDFSSAKSAAKSLYRELAIAQTLSLEKKTSSLAIRLLRKIHKNALKHQILPILEQAAEKLTILYSSSILKNPEQRQNFKTLRNKYRHANEAKHYLYDLYSDMLEDYRRKPIDTIIRMMNSHVKKVNHMIEQHGFRDIQFIGHLYLDSFYQLKGDYHQVISNANLAISRLDQYESVLQDQKIAFHSGIITVNLANNIVDKALIQLDIILETLKQGDSNYYRFLEYAIIINLNTGSYKKAIELYKRINKLLLQRSVNRRSYQQWMLLEAYLKYVAEFLLGSDEYFGKNRLRFNKLRNDTHLLTEQKEVLNLHLYILEFCTAIGRKDFNIVIDRSEAFEKYVQRYVKVKDNARAHYFCKALFQIPKADFHAVRSANYANRYLKKLEKLEGPKNFYITFSEVLPFEVLLQEIFKGLKGFAHLEEKYFSVLHVN